MKRYHRPLYRGRSGKNQSFADAVRHAGHGLILGFIFEANIRLVASAPDEKRALEILQNLESAFAQFSDQSSNEFGISRPGGALLKELIYKFSFRVFDESKKMILNNEELTSLFHFPNIALETPKVEFLKAKDASAQANLPQTGLNLGFNYFRGITSEIKLQKEDRRRPALH